MENLPAFVSIIFIFTTLITILLVYYCFNKSKLFIALSISWVLLQGIISFNDFYLITNSIPPRFLFLILPALLTIVLFFSLKKSKEFVNKLELSKFTLVHIIRIPVEIVLFLLSNYSVVPILMTFEGRNYDILAGFSAPIIFYLYHKNYISNKILLIWNILCLLLLLNIVIHGMLSAPTPFQQFAFDTPNIALLHFPFVWLPCFIVPVVLFSHLVSIIKIIKLKN